MNNNPLNLNRLTIPKIDWKKELKPIEEESAKLEAECKEKYGEDWFDHYILAMAPELGYDSKMKSVNEAIYGAYMPLIIGPPQAMKDTEDMITARLKELFGPFYRFYVKRKPKDPKVADKLIQDTLKTGKWQELPDELQDEYRKKAEGQVK